MTYVAQWPIEDDGLTLSALIAIAWPDGIRMMLHDGVRPAGEPEWEVVEHADQTFLNMTVAVEDHDYLEVA